MKLKEEDIYTWPNPHFPFKCLISHPKVRVFIIENISHNYKWLKKHKNKIRETDFFFVVLGWHLSGHLAKQGSLILESLGINKNNLFILYNSQREKKNGEPLGLKGEVINHNAWLHTDKLKDLSLDKKYDAVYTARAVDFKRHELASGIKKLALIAGGNLHKGEKNKLPPSLNDPSKFLNKDELCKLINQSYCGLCLSKEEGACYSSSEYLLCGIPVVSTQSVGGRDVWYTEHNSIICEPTPESVMEAVSELKNRTWDKEKIRNDHESLAKVYRYRFISKLQEVIYKHGATEIDAAKLFESSFDWYCNPGSNSTPNVDQVSSYFI